MSLNGALQIGRSALTASQAAIQVAGNNMANAATPGYHRLTTSLAPARGEVLGRNQQVGAGVLLQSIRREVDTALQSRFRDALGQEHAALIDQRFLTSIETLQNELSDNDISTLLSTFFNSFSELANNPTDQAVRSVVVQQGQTLAGRLSALRSDYNDVLREVDRSLSVSVEKVNDLLDKIVVVNAQVVDAEGAAGGGQANALRDQRDSLIDELSQLLEVTVIEQANGGVDVLVDSTPILLAGVSRGIDLRTTSDGNTTEVSIRVAADGTTLQVDSGSIGGLMRQRTETVQPVIDGLDTFAGQLIFQVNRIHSQGQGLHGFDAITATNGATDTTATLNSINAALPFQIDNGSFFIHVTHEDTGIRTTRQINVDGNSMSLDDLVNQINTVVGVPNATASISVGGKLTLTANAGYQISFSDDTSGALAALGINTFFEGSDAGDVGVLQSLIDDPSMLAAGAGHVDGSNGTALAIAELPNTRLDALNGKSLRESWQDSITALAVRADAANAAVESTQVVRESLNAQSQAVSGVSLDEESINLLTFQRQFQAAAKFISVIDEALQTLLSIVR